MNESVGLKKCFISGLKIADAVNDLSDLVFLALWDDALKKIDELRKLKHEPEECGIYLSMMFEYLDRLENEIRGQHYDLAYYTIAAIREELDQFFK